MLKFKVSTLIRVPLHTPSTYKKHVCNFSKVPQKTHWMQTYFQSPETQNLKFWLFLDINWEPKTLYF